jgi:hypothetical protein
VPAADDDRVVAVRHEMSLAAESRSRTL